MKGVIATGVWRKIQKGKNLFALFFSFLNNDRVRLSGEEPGMLETGPHFTNAEDFVDAQDDHRECS